MFTTIHLRVFLVCIPLSLLVEEMSTLAEQGHGTTTTAAREGVGARGRVQTSACGGLKWCQHLVESNRAPTTHRVKIGGLLLRQLRVLIGGGHCCTSGNGSEAVGRLKSKNRRLVVGEQDEPPLVPNVQREPSSLRRLARQNGWTES